MMFVEFHPEADAEVSEAARYYEMRKAGLGLDLLQEVELALDQILTNPEASPLVGRRVRRKPMWRFPYNFIFGVFPNRIRVVAFAYQKRRPFYWQRRI